MKRKPTPDGKFDPSRGVMLTAEQRAKKKKEEEANEKKNAEDYRKAKGGLKETSGEVAIKKTVEEFLKYLPGKRASEILAAAYKAHDALGVKDQANPEANAATVLFQRAEGVPSTGNLSDSKIASKSGANLHERSMDVGEFVGSLKGGWNGANFHTNGQFAGPVHVSNPRPPNTSRDIQIGKYLSQLSLAAIKDAGVKGDQEVECLLVNNRVLVSSNTPTGSSTLAKQKFRVLLAETESRISDLAAAFARDGKMDTIGRGDQLLAHLVLDSLQSESQLPGLISALHAIAESVVKGFDPIGPLNYVDAGAGINSGDHKFRFIIVSGTYHAEQNLMLALLESGMSKATISGTKHMCVMCFLSAQAVQAFNCPGLRFNQHPGAYYKEAVDGFERITSRINRNADWRKWIGDNFPEFAQYVISTDQNMRGKVFPGTPTGPGLKYDVQSDSEDSKEENNFLHLGGVKYEKRRSQKLATKSTATDQEDDRGDLPTLSAAFTGFDNRAGAVQVFPGKNLTDVGNDKGKCQIHYRKDKGGVKLTIKATNDRKLELRSGSGSKGQGQITISLGDLPIKFGIGFNDFTISVGSANATPQQKKQPQKAFTIGSSTGSGAAATTPPKAYRLVPQDGGEAVHLTKFERVRLGSAVFVAAPANGSAGVTIVVMSDDSSVSFNAPGSATGTVAAKGGTTGPLSVGTLVTLISGSSSRSYEIQKDTSHTTTTTTSAGTTTATKPKSQATTTPETLSGQNKLKSFRLESNNNEPDIILNSVKTTSIRGTAKCEIEVVASQGVIVRPADSSTTVSAANIVKNGNSTSILAVSEKFTMKGGKGDEHTFTVRY